MEIMYWWNNGCSQALMSSRMFTGHYHHPDHHQTMACVGKITTEGISYEKLQDSKIEHVGTT